MCGIIGVKDIVTIGITNQRETTIVWDKITGKPLYNAIGEYYNVYQHFKSTSGRVHTTRCFA